MTRTDSREETLRSVAEAVETLLAVGHDTHDGAADDARNICMDLRWRGRSARPSGDAREMALFLFVEAAESSTFVPVHCIDHSRSPSIPTSSRCLNRRTAFCLGSYLARLVQAMPAAGLWRVVRSIHIALHVSCQPVVRAATWSGVGICRTGRHTATKIRWRSAWRSFVWKFSPARTVRDVDLDAASTRSVHHDFAATPRPTTGGATPTNTHPSSSTFSGIDVGCAPCRIPSRARC